jgi:hypothetical protein
VQDELDPDPCVVKVHDQVTGLLDDPRFDRVPGGAEDPDAARAVLYDGQYTLVPLSRSAVKKSSARIPCAWDRRKSAQPGQRHDTGDDQ